MELEAVAAAAGREGEGGVLSAADREKEGTRFDGGGGAAAVAGTETETAQSGLSNGGGTSVVVDAMDVEEVEAVGQQTEAKANGVVVVEAALAGRIRRGGSHESGGGVEEAKGGEGQAVRVVPAAAAAAASGAAAHAEGVDDTKRGVAEISKV